MAISSTTACLPASSQPGNCSSRFVCSSRCGCSFTARRANCSPRFFWDTVEAMKFRVDLLRRCGVFLLVGWLGILLSFAQSAAATAQLPAAPSEASSGVSLAAAQKLVQQGRLDEALRALDALAAQKP